MPGALIAQTPILEWSREIPGSSWNTGVAVSTGPDGNMVCVGEFNDEADLDPGPGTEIHTSTGGQDAFVLKLASDGSFLWAFALAEVRPRDVAIDSQGAVYVVGEMNSDTLDVDPEGTHATIQRADGGGFLAKYAADGTYLFSIQVPSSSSIRSITVLSDDRVSLVGKYGVTGSTVDLDPGPGVVQGLGRRCFLITLNADGSFSWGHSYGHNSALNGLEFLHIANDDGDNLVISGTFSGLFNTDPDGSNASLDNYQTLSTHTSTFLIRTDSEGLFDRALGLLGGTNSPANLGCGSLGQITLIASYYAPIDIDPGPDQLFLSNPDSLYLNYAVVRMDSAGQLLWGHGFGGTSNDQGQGLLIRNDDGFYLSGTSLGAQVDLDPGPGVTNLSPYAGTLCLYSATGDYTACAPLTGTVSNALLSLSPAADDAFFGVGFRANSVVTSAWISKWRASLAAVPENSNNDWFNLQPNPSDGHLLLSLSGVDGKIPVEVRDAMGRSCWNARLGSGAQHIDLSYLNAGVYTMIWTKNGDRHQVRFVIQ